MRLVAAAATIVRSGDGPVVPRRPPANSAASLTTTSTSTQVTFAAVPAPARPTARHELLLPRRRRRHRQSHRHLATLVRPSRRRSCRSAHPPATSTLPDRRCATRHRVAATRRLPSPFARHPYSPTCPGHLLAHRHRHLLCPPSRGILPCRTRHRRAVRPSPASKRSCLALPVPALPFHPVRRTRGLCLRRSPRRRRTTTMHRPVALSKASKPFLEKSEQ